MHHLRVLLFCHGLVLNLQAEWRINDTMATNMSLSGVEVRDVAHGDVISPFVQVHAFLPSWCPWDEAGGAVGVSGDVAQEASFVALSS